MINIKIIEHTCTCTYLKRKTSCDGSSIILERSQLGLSGLAWQFYTPQPVSMTFSQLVNLNGTHVTWPHVVSM